MSDEQRAVISTIAHENDGVLVCVADVEPHFERATAADARILSRHEEGGEGDRCRAEDPEGRRWMFVQR